MTKTFKHLIEGKPLRLRRSPIDDVKKAIEIAKKMAGNHTDAVKEIEKIQKGLSNHIRVKDALRTANEEAPANATGTAVAGTGDDSSTVLVKRRKELQKRLLRRFSAAFKMCFLKEILCFLVDVSCL